MSYRIRRKAECAVGVWSGGTTTELFLWPQQASYAARDFSVRVSSATIDIDESDFTALPGFTRLLMKLSGDLRLDIEGDCITFQEGTVLRFDGGKKARSYGRCVDIGIMLGRGWDGSLQEISAPGVYACAESGFTGVYAPGETGARILLPRGEIDLQLESGDLLMVEGEERIEIQLQEKVVLFTAYASEPLKNRL